MLFEAAFQLEWNDQMDIGGSRIEATADLPRAGFWRRWKTGRTLGARIVAVRVIDAAAPGVSEVPIRKAIIRYLAMAIGFVPMFAVLIYQYAVNSGGADAVFTGNFFRWFTYAGVFGLLWVVALISQIATKKDPVYDRLAGTAVVRD